MKMMMTTIAASVLLMTACNDAPKADKVEASAAQEVANATGATYKANPTASTVEWVGTKPTGQHHGTIMIKNGEIAVKDNQITGGKFILDLTTIKPDDQDEEGNEKLRKHLSSEDFFDVAQHPEASFELSAINVGIDTANKDIVLKDATHTITGNLTLKGIAKSISFPAKVAIAEKQVTADANFNIDRTQWGMNYKSDKSLGDKIIHPMVNLKLHLVAER